MSWRNLLRTGRIAAGAVLLGGAAFLAGWYGSEAGREKPPSRNPQASLAGGNGSSDKVLARIGEENVTLADWILAHRSLPPEARKAEPEEMFDALLERLVDEAVLVGEAKARGLDRTPDATAALRAQTRRFLVQQVLQDMARNDVETSEVRGAYDARYAQAPPVTEIRARHILVAQESEAEAIYERLQKGEDFAALARAHSTDGTGATGGDLGWFSREDMVAEFADAAFALEDGQMSKPVQSPFGWHIIARDASRTRPVPPFGDVETNLRMSLLFDNLQIHLAALRARAGVEIVKDAIALEALLRELEESPEP